MARVPLYSDYLNKMGCEKKSDSELAKKVESLTEQLAETEKKQTDLEDKVEKLTEALVPVNQFGGEASFQAIDKDFKP
ncbi:hypothetical protein BMT54_01770 [Pasteurellaceae bacterium 15-036681]|nr:hypothetical protein BMT54_01770 [Pasteurellaceae bacterium 15-036681]